MLKLLLLFLSVSSSIAQEGRCSILAGSTPQVVVDLVRALKNLRNELGIVPAELPALIDLSNIGAYKALEIDAECAIAPGYGFSTNGACCPPDNETNLHECVRGPNARRFGSAFDGDYTIVHGVYRNLPPEGLNLNNMREILKDLMDNHPHFQFLKGQLEGVSFNIPDEGKTAIVIMGTKGSEEYYYERCDPGVPSQSTTIAPSTTTISSTTTTTTIPSVTTTVSSATTTTNSDTGFTSPSGATTTIPSATTTTNSDTGFTSPRGATTICFFTLVFQLLHR